MRCPACGELEDKVIDSRTAEDGRSIRRRRACISCGRRFTTFERVEELSLLVVKRSGHKEPFERSKIVSGVKSALKNRPVSADQIEAMAGDIEDTLRSEGSEVSSQRVGRMVLEHLRDLDEVGYLRFASVYKGFADVRDFEREFSYLSKDTEPKRPKA
ncbi:MAG: transcriptional repressor NrdR [Actinomycetota bacterium]|nr:MAG: transcriptional repressor NrdR [Actinomycetota bacterium]